MKKIVFAISLLSIVACSPGQKAANHQGKAEYVSVGCHVVTKNPAKGNTYAFSVAGDLKVGDKFYFKQVGLDGTVGPVVTGVPCKYDD